MTYVYLLLIGLALVGTFVFALALWFDLNKWAGK